MSVAEALAAITAELPAIGKAERSPQGYAYRGIEAITAKLQPLLAKHGVVIVPVAKHLSTVPSPGMKEMWQDVYLEVGWRVYGPAGDFVEGSTVGIGRDNSDKGANKAQTQAFKYLLLDLFCIGDGSDDSDAHTDPEPQPVAKPRRQLHPEVKAMRDVMNAIKDLTYQESVKEAFKMKYGDPYEIPESLHDDAWAWVELQSKDADEFKAPK